VIRGGLASELSRREFLHNVSAAGAAERIVGRSRDLGLPPAPRGFQGGRTPPVHVGDRIVPKLPRAKRR
jgi:hypothetical protein